MALFKSGYPSLSEKVFSQSIAVQGTEVMTVRGTISKFSFLFVMVLASAVFTWHMYYQGGNVTPYLYGGGIGGFVIGIVIIFKKDWSPYLAPAYGLAEGLFLGAVSAFFNDAFAEKQPYLVLQAVGLTFGVVIAMLLLYQFRIIKATKAFRSVVVTATMGIGIFYLMTLGLRFFGIDIPFVHEGSLIGIIFSLGVVTIAALNLILDFDKIETGSQQGVEKYMEWYCAFGLLVTIVWLYIEVLRLLAKLNSRK